MTLKREFLTTDEVAEILGISAFTIRRYIQSRKLRAVRLEASYRIRLTDLERFVKARLVGSADETERSAKARRRSARRKAAKAKSRSRTRKSGIPRSQRRVRRRPRLPA